MNFIPKVTVLVLFLIISLFSGCTNYKAPELRKIEDLRLKMRGGSNVELFGKLIFYNPNTVKLKLKSYHLDVYLEDTKITELKDQTNMTIYPEKEFDMTAVAAFQLDELDGNIFQSALGLLSNRMELRFVGYIKIARNGLTIKIPVDKREKVKF